jgi:hypothetical protein
MPLVFAQKMDITVDPRFTYSMGQKKNSTSIEKYLNRDGDLHRLACNRV